MKLILCGLLVLIVTSGCRATDGSVPMGGSPAAAEGGGFIARVGDDTVAVERFARSGSVLNVQQVRRSPRTGLRHARLDLSEAGELSGMYVAHLSIGGSADARPIASTRFTFLGDSGTVELTIRDSVHAPRRVPVSKTMIPAVLSSFFPFEIAAKRLRAGRSDSLLVTLVLADGSTTPVMVRALGPDSMTFRLPSTTYRARVDCQGRLLWMHAPSATQDTVVERAPMVDVPAIAAAWAAKEQQIPEDRP